jgi:hypothetical protein
VSTCKEGQPLLYAKVPHRQDISHNSSHNELNEYIEKNLHNFSNLKQIVLNGGKVQVAYDGLELFAD